MSEIQDLSTPNSVQVKDPVWKILKKTSLFQLALFLIGFTNELRLTGSMTSPVVSSIDGFGVVWTDDLVLSAIFAIALLFTVKWSPRVAAWLKRVIRSLLHWAVIGGVGFAAGMAMASVL
jgi:hypothetical protein